jgi:hypothetical protein
VRAAARRGGVPPVNSWRLREHAPDWA